MKSIHFVGEWFDCCAPERLLADPQAMRARCMEHVARRHLPISYEYFTRTAAHGVIGAMTGNDVHIVLRSFPHRKAVMADLFVHQGEPAEIGAAMQVFDGLRDELRPMRALLHRMPRDGQVAPVHGRTPHAPTEVLLSAPVRSAV